MCEINLSFVGNKPAKCLHTVRSTSVVRAVRMHFAHYHAEGCFIITLQFKLDRPKIPQMEVKVVSQDPPNLLDHLRAEIQVPR